MKKDTFLKRTLSLLVLITIVFQCFSVVYANETIPETHEFIEVSADTYVRGGEYSGLNFGGETTLEFKSSSSKVYNRFVYLAFDISSQSAQNLSNAKINLYVTEAEKNKEKVYVRAFSTNEFDEYTITENDPQTLKKIIGAGYAQESLNSWITIDITEYIRSEIENNTQMVYIILYDRFDTNLKLAFSSREGNNKPYLDLKYGGIPDPIEPFDDGMGFSGATKEQAIENARKMIAQSTAEYKDQNALNPVKKISDTEFHFMPTDDAFVNGGANAGANFGKDGQLIVKSSPTSGIYTRYSYLKFDISESNASTAGGVFLKLRITTLEGGGIKNVYLHDIDDTTWNEDSLTWDTAPEIPDLILDTQPMKDTNKYVIFDVTNHVNSLLSQGKTQFSFALKDVDTNNLQFIFSSKEGDNPPLLMVMDIGGEPGSVPNPIIAHEEEQNAPDGYDYIEVDVNRNKKPFTNFTPTKTRIISSITDFTPTTQAPEVSVYGGLLSKQYEATGFFYVTQTNGRWWFIDPLGHPMFNFALGSVSAPRSDHEKAGMERRYGTVENWANSISQEFRDMGFNSAGISDSIASMMEQRIPYTRTMSCIGPYGSQKGMVTYAGSTIFKDNVMPVFDPQFENYVDIKVSSIEKYKDDPYLIGWFSDNEISVGVDMLENYLKQDPEDDNYIFSYYTAWEWLKDRYGEDASLDDITAVDKDDWREFVFDRYYSLISKTFKKYAPNHLYMGSRLNGVARDSEGIFKAAGRYCDVISFNYYGVWTPNLEQMDNWYKWSGKPCLITECYTKGMDALERVPGLTNESGAGWIVPTQTDRGYFYQNYALALLESKTCVGWHWYKYQDNDPDGDQTDVSNLDSNKGIVDRDFNDYPELIEKMTELNYNTYALIDYFDNIPEEKTFEYVKNITNNTDQPRDCIMILGLYDQDDKLVKVAIGDSVTIDPGKSENVFASFVNTPEVNYPEFKVRGFVWEDLFNIKPLTKAEDLR